MKGTTYAIPIGRPELDTSTAPIACLRKDCGWSGQRTDLIKKSKADSLFSRQMVCPLCSGDVFKYLPEKKA